MADSALFYSEKGYRWATRFQYFEYPIMMIQIDPDYETEARKIFDMALQNFKSRVPSELWDLAEYLNKRFNILVEGDTTALIKIMQKAFEDFGQGSTHDRYSLGKLLVSAGHYQQGREWLLTLIAGRNQTTRGFYYLSALYHIGMADEALGNIEEAIAKYNEVLRYWANPEIEFKEIVNIRSRLTRLAG
jgi:tetratricopeptide (TPR) repeat protein